MSIFGKIKKWFKDTFSSGSKSSGSSSKKTTKRASTASNYGGGGSRSYKSSSNGGYTSKTPIETKEQRQARIQKEQKQKRDNVTNSLASIGKQTASISKRTDALSSGKTQKVANTVTRNTLSGAQRVNQKIGEKAKKATPPQAKVTTKKLKQIADNSENLAKIKKRNKEITNAVVGDRDAFNKATGDKYNVDKNGLKARQAQKMQAYDVNAEKYETKAHPNATSFARGATSGVTFGASELLLQKSKNRKKSGAEEFYQKNKNRKAEVAGEIAGSLASFGLTGGASSAVGKKVGGNALGRFAERRVADLAENSIVRRAAARELQNAVEQGAVKVGSKAAERELINEFAKNRARRIVNAVGEDMAINLTTGLASDTSHAILDSDNPEEFVKNMALSGAINLGLGGATSIAPALRTRGGLPFVGNRVRQDTMDVLTRLDREQRQSAAREGLNDLIRGRRAGAMPLSAPRIGESIDDRIARESMRRTFTGNADNAARVDMNELLARNADNLRPPEVRAQNAVPEVRPQVAENATPQENLFLSMDDTLGELDRKGETWLGEHGHITANEDGTYNLFVNGVGDRTLTRADAEDYIRRATADLNGYAERTRATRVSPLTEAENARIAEIDNEVARLRAEGLEDANQLKANNYKGLDEYQSRQAELGRRESELTREKDNIIRKEPPMREEAPRVEPPRQADDAFPYEGTPEADDMMRRINEGKQRNAETYANEQEALEGRVRELENEPPRMEGEEPLRVNNVAEDTPIGGTTMGERMAHSAYERNTGETVDKGLKTSWHDAWEASREYHASHATGRDTRLSRTSVSQLNMMDSDAERELRDKLVDEGWLDYTVVHTDEMLDRVSKKFRDDPKRWVDDMIDVNNGRNLDFRETPEWQAMAHYIMAVVDPSADSASEIAYTEAYKLATQMSSKAGQTNNLRRQFVHLTPAGRRDAIMDEMAQILYNSQGFHNQHRDIPSDKYDALAYVKEFLEGDEEIEKRVKKLVEVGGLRRDAEYGLDTAVENATESAARGNEGFAAVADDMPLDGATTASASKTAKNKADSDEIMEAHAELIAALNEKNPKSALDVVQEIRYLNMLGNPKTHIRNVFGSGFFAPIRQTSNTFRSLIENSSYIKNSGVEVTLHGGLSPTALVEAHVKNPTTESGKKALEAYERIKPELLGSMKLDNQLYSGRAKHLTGKMLDAVSDFNSTLLSKEDDFFKQRAFRENYIKSYEAYKRRGVPITKKIEKKIEAEAMQEANIATFNEYNEFAKFLSKITSKATDPNASGLAKAGGLAVNAVMPFTKVPANIMKQSVNYSPIGLIKGYSGMRNAIKKGDSDALNRAIDELASGLTGTGIFGLGMLLGKTTDMFTTNAGKDDAAAKFKKAQGVQNYSVSVDIGGQKYSVTLDWLVPNSATFFAGVEMANQMKAGDFNVFDFGGSWAQVTSRIVEPVMETSMLSGLYSMLESTRNGYGDDDKQSALSIMARETAQSYINSLVPTMLGQASRTLYKNDKQITGATDNEYFRNQLKSKLGLAETNILGEELGADTTAYGDVKGQKETTGDYIKSALKNFVSPANIQKIDLDEMDREKIKQYEDAVKNGADPTEMAYLFPKKQYKKEFATGDMEVKMSNKDLSTYNQAKTTGGTEGMRWVLESIMFNRYDKDADGNRVSRDDAFTTAQKQELMKQFEGKSLREVEKWLRDQPQFKNASEAEQKKAIDGLWSYSKQGKSQGAKRVGEQAVIEAQGGDVNEYNFNNEITEKKRAALQPFIENGTITYEEAVDFARFAGKTYYYEDDEGGHSQTYYNKGVMMEYLKSKGYDDETAAALFNAFKAANAKEYGASSNYRRRYGRRRWRRWRRRSGGSSKKATVPTPKTIKAKDLVQGQALVSKKKSGSNTTNTNPTLKRVKAKIDLPTAKPKAKK